MHKDRVVHQLPETINGRSISEVFEALDKVDFTADETRKTMKLAGYAVDYPPGVIQHPPHEAVDFTEIHPETPYLSSFLVRCTETNYKFEVPAVTVDTLDRYLADNGISRDLEASSVVRTMRRGTRAGETNGGFFAEDAQAIARNNFGIVAVEAVQFINDNHYVRRLGILVTGLRAEMALNRYSDHIAEAIGW